MVLCALFPGIIHFFALYPNTYNTVIFPVLLPKLISTYSFFTDNWFNTFSFKRDTIFFFNDFVILCDLICKIVLGPLLLLYDSDTSASQFILCPADIPITSGKSFHH